MFKYVYFYLIIITCFTNCKLDNDPYFNHNFTLDIENKITLELGSNFPSAFDLIQLSDSSEILVAQDIHENQIIFFDLNGHQIGKIELPSIDEPQGIYRISDVYVINKDSILVYDAQFLRLALLNQESTLIDYWNLSDFWNTAARSVNVGIVDAYNKKDELSVELIAFENTYSISDQAFYEQTRMLHLVNLTTKKVNSKLQYPTESPYQTQVFYAAFAPYIVKTKPNQYIVTFPFDHNLYIFDLSLNAYRVIIDEPSGFPNATGESFGTPQSNNLNLISRKLNGFGLQMKAPLHIQGLDSVIIRVYRKALGNNDLIPNVGSFASDKFPPEYYLEVFKLDKNNLIKVGNEINISPFNLGNYIGQDQEGYLYFLEYNNEVEDPVIVKVSLNIAGGSKE